MIKLPETVFNKNTFCSFCGTRHTEQKAFPRTCFRCYNITYANPLPVVVGIIPVWLDNYSWCGWLTEQRNIPPGKDGWALPGGYIELGETWQQALTRELKEEVGLITKPEDFRLVDVINAPSGHILTFGAHRGVQREEILFTANSEVRDIAFPIAPADLELCFSTHSEMWSKYYNSCLYDKLCEDQGIYYE